VKRIGEENALDATDQHFIPSTQKTDWPPHWRHRVLRAYPFQSDAKHPVFFCLSIKIDNPVPDELRFEMEGFVNAQQDQTRRSFLPSWRQLFFWPASVFVVLYVTQSLWLPLLVPWAMHRGTEWEFVSRRATESKNPELLQGLAMETKAPGEVRGTAWAALGKRSEQVGDKTKAADCYLSALDCLVSDPHLTGQGYKLRDEVWDQLRFHLGTEIDPQRYRMVLVSWAERSKDQHLLEQLVFELGKMKLLTKAEPTGDVVEIKR
jgi:hypothetical protein